MVCVFTLHILVMNLTKSCLHVFPENNLSLLTKKADSLAGSPLGQRLGWKTRGLTPTSSLPCAGNQEFLGFCRLSHPKAEVTEVGITHSIKNTERQRHNLWESLETKKDPRFPTNRVWVLVSLCTKLLQKNQNKRLTS